MKKITLILILVLIPLFSGAQISIDSVAYKSFRSTIYINGQQITGNSDVLFYINNGKVTSSVNNQAKTLYFKETPHFREIGTDQPNLSARCYDDGGYRCHFWIVYEEKTNTYGLVIDYSNVLFFFQCKLSNERLWDEEPIDWVREGEKYRDSPVYTDAEVEEFLSQFGNPKVLKAAIIQNFYMEYSLHTNDQ